MFAQEFSEIFWLEVQVQVLAGIVDLLHIFPFNIVDDLIENKNQDTAW
jgi:hypothetical protein